MSAAPCRFAGTPEVRPIGETSLARYLRVGDGSVRVGKEGIYSCLSCYAHSGPHGTGCARTRAAEAHDRAHRDARADGTVAA